MSTAKKEVKISFFQGKKLTCPVCNNDFRREILRSGRGRLIAGDLMHDLRRTWKPSPKYGLINPLIYNIIVCPHCYYAVLPDDFRPLKPQVADIIKMQSQNRQKYGDMAFGYVNYDEERTLMGGALSFFLAISSYAHLPKEFAPTTKRGICAVRASWLCMDLHDEDKSKGYDRLYEYFRYLAWKCYDKSVDIATTGKEDFGSIKFLGPDTDTNYGYEGVLYMSCYLGIEQALYWDEKTKYERFKKYRTVMAKVFGFGKSSKEKPGPLLDSARDLHEEIGKFILANRDKYETDKRDLFFNQ